MLEKTEKKEQEDSDIETEKRASVNTSKISTSVNPKKFLFNDYHPKFLFSNEDKNLSYYETDSNNSYREKKYRSLNNILRNRNNNCNFILKKNTLPQTNYIKENFTYNLINIEENNENQKNNDSFNHKIPLNNYLIQSCNKAPKRTIRPQQSEYDVEKSDNFNVISSKSKKKIHKKRRKIIQYLRKGETEGFFYPSKRTQPLLSPLPLNNYIETDKVYTNKTPVSKTQRFFGTHRKVNNDDEEKKELNKTLSKRKRLQFEDYNIEKLIEIGDNTSNKYKNLLSFGKKINSIRNKNNNNNNKLNNKTFDIIFNKLSVKKKLNKIGNKKGYLNIKKRINVDNLNNILDKNKDKKLIKNKIINNSKRYHNFKIMQTYNNIYDDISNNKLKDNFNETQRIKKNINQDITEDNNIEVEIQDFIGKPDPRGRNHYYKKKEKEYTQIIGETTPRKFFLKKDKEYSQIFGGVTPRKLFIKKEADTNSNLIKKKFSIKNFKHINNYINQKRFSNTIISKENTARNELKPKILISEDKNIYKSNKNIMQKNKLTVRNSQINNKENKTKQKNNKNYLIKKSNEKLKNYYGYDERHPLEGTINNHSTFVSIYSRKIINHSNHSRDKRSNIEK